MTNVVLSWSSLLVSFVGVDRVAHSLVADAIDAVFHTSYQVRVWDCYLFHSPRITVWAKGTILICRNEDRWGPIDLRRLEGFGGENFSDVLLNLFPTLWSSTLWLLTNSKCTRLHLNTMGNLFYFTKLARTNLLVSLQNKKDHFSIVVVLYVCKVSQLTSVLRGLSFRQCSNITVGLQVLGRTLQACWALYRADPVFSCQRALVATLENNRSAWWKSS